MSSSFFSLVFCSLVFVRCFRWYVRILYRDGNQLKVETDGVGVHDLDIGDHVKAQGDVALVDNVLGGTLWAQVVDGGDLEYGHGYDGQDNGYQNEQNADAAGDPTAGRTNAWEAGQAARLLLAVLDQNWVFVSVERSAGGFEVGVYWREFAVVDAVAGAESWRKVLHVERLNIGVVVVAVHVVDFFLSGRKRLVGVV